MNLYAFKQLEILTEKRGILTNFPKVESFDTTLVQSKIMGPNPLKLAVELLCDNCIAKGSVVLDPGSGTGITSAMLAHEYDLTVYAKGDRVTACNTGGHVPLCYMPRLC